jgi:hypothetical protein
MSAEYVAAAMVACRRCGAEVGSPCFVIACRNGYRECTYKACSYRKELPEPHLERAVAARLASCPVVPASRVLGGEERG